MALDDMASPPISHEKRRIVKLPSAAERFRVQRFGLIYRGLANDAFTLRLRLPGGRLRGYQLLGRAEII